MYVYFSFIIPFISVRFLTLRYVPYRTSLGTGTKLFTVVIRHLQTAGLDMVTKSYNLKLMGLKNILKSFFVCIL